MAEPDSPKDLASNFFADLAKDSEVSDGLDDLESSSRLTFSIDKNGDRRIYRKNKISKKSGIQKSRKEIVSYPDDISLGFPEMVRRIGNLCDQDIIDLLLAFGWITQQNDRYYTSDLFEGFYLGRTGCYSRCPKFGHLKCRGNHSVSYCPYS